MSNPSRSPVKFTLVGAATPSVTMDEIQVPRHTTVAEEPRTRGLLASAYPTRKRATWALTALFVGVAIAGFWNAGVVDGFGRETVAGSTIGDPNELATTYGEENGLGFGAVFALIVGMAATFTACNCVVFAMIPGMTTCSTSRAESRRKVLVTIGVMLAGVTLVSLVYGAFIGFLGSAGLEAFNANPVRRARSLVVFSSIGLFMMAWAAIEFGFLDRTVQKASPVTRAFFGQPSVKAGIMGVLIGLFAVGRPFGPFRAFETYAAATNNATYGAITMAIQGIGQILLMLAILLAITYFAGDRLLAWVRTKPAQPALLSALALTTGGMYFVFYWGLARMFDVGKWGPKLGLW